MIQRDPDTQSVFILERAGCRICIHICVGVSQFQMDSNSVYFLYHSITWVSSSIFKRTPQLWITICIPRFKWACRLTRLCQHAPNRHVSLCPDLGTQQHGPHACVQHWVHVDEFITINTDYFCEDDSILYLPAHIKMNLWLTTPRTLCVLDSQQILSTVS